MTKSRKPPKVSGLVQGGTLATVSQTVLDRMPDFSPAPGDEPDPLQSPPGADDKHESPPSLPRADDEQEHPQSPPLPDAPVVVATAATTTPPASTRASHRSSDRIIQKIPLHLIDRSPYQNRAGLDANYVSDLAENMRVDGLNEPIVVRSRAEGRFELLAGDNRHAAAGLLGWREIDAEIRNIDDNKAARLVFFDNYFHKPLQDYEVYRGFANLIELGKSSGTAPSLRSLAKEAGISSSQMGRLFAFAKLPDKVRAILDEHPEILQANAAESLTRFCDGSQDHLIVDAIEQLRDGKLTQGRAAVWIEHRVSARPTKTERTLTSVGGKQFAKLERKGQRLTVMIAAGVDSAAIEEAVFVILQQHADKGDAS